MKRMQTLTCIVLALSLLLGLGLAGAQAESAGKIVVFQQKTEIYDQLVELAKAYQEETGVEVEVWPIAGDDYYQNLKTYMASESGPTVFTLNSASEIAEIKRAEYAGRCADACQRQDGYCRNYHYENFLFHNYLRKHSRQP